MTVKMNLNAFADEAGSSVEEQIAALRRNGLQGVELRGVDGENVSDITVQKAREVYRRFSDAGLKIWSIGSPLGKIEMGKDPFEPHLDKLRHTLELADALSCRQIRMFSFYIPSGREPAEYRQEVLERLCRMTEISADSGVVLCHENEKGIYGDTPERCDDLLQNVPGLQAIFDPANFVQCGVDTWAAWQLLGSRIRYLHIKDALADGNVVPAGQGAGRLGEILGDFIRRGGRDLTLEPHLTVFDGLAGLEHGEEIKVGKTHSFPNKSAAFDAACAALRELLEKEGD